MMGKHLLILGCSARKREHERRLAALELYDGPLFRVIRRQLALAPILLERVDIWVLSAQFGLVRADEKLPFYECKLTPTKIPALRLLVREQWEATQSDNLFSSGFIALGDLYKSILPDALPFNHASLCWAQGAPGTRATALKQWLKNVAGTINCVESRSTNRKLFDFVSRQASLAGQEIILSPSDLRRALKRWEPNHPLVPCWCVFLEDQHIPVKWLAWQLTGISRSQFSTDQARRFFVTLGFHPEIAEFSNFSE